MRKKRKCKNQHNMMVPFEDKHCNFESLKVVIQESLFTNGATRRNGLHV